MELIGGVLMVASAILLIPVGVPDRAARERASLGRKILMMLYPAFIVALFTMGMAKIIVSLY